MIDLLIEFIKGVPVKYTNIQRVVGCPHNTLNNFVYKFAKIVDSKWLPIFFHEMVKYGFKLHPNQAHCSMSPESKDLEIYYYKPIDSQNSGKVYKMISHEMPTCIGEPSETQKKLQLLLLDSPYNLTDISYRVANNSWYLHDFVRTTKSWERHIEYKKMLECLSCFGLKLFEDQYRLYVENEKLMVVQMVELNSPIRRVDKTLYTKERVVIPEERWKKEKKDVAFWF